MEGFFTIMINGNAGKMDFITTQKETMKIMLKNQYWYYLIKNCFLCGAIFLKNVGLYLLRFIFQIKQSTDKHGLVKRLVVCLTTLTNIKPSLRGMN